MEANPAALAFSTCQLPDEPSVTAPDGSDVRLLLSLAGGSFAHFSLPAGGVSQAIEHRTVEEIWYITAGHGQMWRQQFGVGINEAAGQPGIREQTIELRPGICLTIPSRTRFQFRAAADQSLAAVAVTMPPWPGDDEVVFVTGCWGS